MKSIETRFAEAMDALKKARRTKQFDEKAKGCTTIETKLNAAEELLKDVGIVREVAPIRKHNGATDNFVEGNPFGPTAAEFRESSNSFSPGFIKEVTDPFAKGDKVMYDGWLKTGRITEAQHAKLLGNKPAGYDQLTETQRKEFDSLRLIHISEADAFKLVKGTVNNFREASRR